MQAGRSCGIGPISFTTRYSGPNRHILCFSASNRYIICHFCGKLTQTSGTTISPALFGIRHQWKTKGNVVQTKQRTTLSTLHTADKIKFSPSNLAVPVSSSVSRLSSTQFGLHLCQAKRIRCFAPCDHSRTCLEPPDRRQHGSGNQPLDTPRTNIFTFMRRYHRSFPGRRFPSTLFPTTILAGIFRSGWRSDAVPIMCGHTHTNSVSHQHEGTISPTTSGKSQKKFIMRTRDRRTRKQRDHKHGAFEI